MGTALTLYGQSSRIISICEARPASIYERKNIWFSTSGNDDAARSPCGTFELLHWPRCHPSDSAPCPVHVLHMTHVEVYSPAVRHRKQATKSSPYAPAPTPAPPINPAGAQLNTLDGQAESYHQCSLFLAPGTTL